MPEVLALNKVSYAYKDGNRRLQVLKDADVSFALGALYAIVGPSGSGKTTLLALASALDTPQSGQVLYAGQDVRTIGLQEHRRKNVALIFQSYNLLTYMTALENVLVAIDIAGSHRGNRRQAACDLLSQVGITADEARRNVLRLSGGQQQRVAIARALASDASVILADEPTGNLDSDTAQEIISLFIKAAHDLGKCVVVVTHAEEIASQADVVYRISNGTLETVRATPTASVSVKTQRGLS